MSFTCDLDLDFVQGHTVFYVYLCIYVCSFPIMLLLSNPVIPPLAVSCSFNILNWTFSTKVVCQQANLCCTKTSSHFWPDCKASPVYELAKTICPSVCLSVVNNLRLAVAFSLVSHKPLMIHKSNFVRLFTLMSSSQPIQNLVTLTLTSRFSEHTLILTLSCSLSHH